MQTLKKYLFLLTSHERKSAGLLLFMILIMALLDMIGVASILPFVAVLTNPSLIETNFILKAMFQKASLFGVEDTQQFLFILGFLVFFLLIITLIFKSILTYVQVRFVHMRQYSIGKRLVEGYLHQPYTWFLNHHSSDLGTNILTEVSNVIGGGLSSLLELIAKSMVTIAIIILLIINDPKLALIVGISFSSAYLLIFYFSRSYLKRIGKERLKSNESRFMAVNEAFSAAKEIKVGGLEQTYIDSFSNSAQNYARTISAASVISLLPRFFLEAVAFGGILLIILSMMSESGDLNTALPILSLYIFAGYRLMPALQAIYLSFSSLTFINPSLDKLHDDIKNLKPIEKNQDDILGVVFIDPSHPEQDIRVPENLRKYMGPTLPPNWLLKLMNETGLFRLYIGDRDQLIYKSIKSGGFYDELEFLDNEMKEESSNLNIPNTQWEIPLTIISAGQNGKNFAPNAGVQIQKEAQEYWDSLQIEISKLSSKGKRIIAEKSGHMMLKSESKLISDEILKIIQLKDNIKND